MMMIDAGMKTCGLMLRQARRTGFAVPWVLSGGVDCGVNVLAVLVKVSSGISVGVDNPKRRRRPVRINRAHHTPRITMESTVGAATIYG